MKHLQYLLAVLLLMVSPAAWAQFNPENPDEPGTRPWRLTLKAVPATGGYYNVNALSMHAAGEEVYLHAYSHSDFGFVQWEDEQGNVLSTANDLSYTMPAKDITLVARFKYAPEEPEEPGQASIKRHLYLRTNPANTGWFNLSSDNDITVGEQVYIEAYNSSQHYSFRNWTQDGSIISTSKGFTYTMPDKDVTLVVNYDYSFSPDSPDEPGEFQGDLYNIYGMREAAKAGHTLTYPLYLQNRGSSVTGFAVDVTFPSGFTAEADAATLSERAATQSLQAESQPDGSYRFTVSGTENIQGVEGKVLSIPLHVPDTATIGNLFTITFTNGVVFKADGSQANAGVRSGSVQIIRDENERPDSPDYVVSDVATTSGDVMPQDAIHLTWKVENRGNLAGMGGWTERIYLIAPNGRKVNIGSTYYDTETLQPGATVDRSATVSLPRLPGIDGNVDLGVTIIPGVGAGEASDFLTNNSAQTSGTPLTVGKQLILEMPQATLQEGEATTVRCQLLRSGSWATSETFDLSKQLGDDRLSVPATVTIPREQAAAYFYLNLTNNAVCDNDSAFTIQVSGNGYGAQQATLIVRDDELPPLRLTASATDVTEGDTFQLTVTLGQPAAQELNVSLSSERPKRFRMPAYVTIAAGQTQASVDVETIDDDIPDSDASCAFKAFAYGYDPAEAIVMLNDNDLPVLELSFAPSRVKESDGPVSITGTLRRTTNVDKKIIVRLSDDSNGALFFSQSELTLPKGVEQVHFNLGPVDNNQAEGDRTYTVTAAVWLSSCSCSASGQAAGHVQAQLQVFDDDGPALMLTTTEGTVREGVTTRLILTRNTSTAQPLTVRLSSDHDDMLTYNHNITIAAGQPTAYVEVTPTANDTQEDSQTIVFTAEADGYSSGTCWLLVTDQTLPDAHIMRLEANPSEAEAGSSVTVSVVVANNGVANLRDATPVFVYRRGSDVPVVRLYTAGELPAGEQQTLSKEMTLPTTVGDNHYYVVANAGNKIKELSYTNNTSADLLVRSLSSFRTEVSTDKAVYSQGDKVVISGRLLGSNVSEAEADVYMTNDGVRQVRRIKADANGRFSTEWQLYPLQAGHFSVGACYPDEGSSKEQASFSVYGLQRADSRYITCEVTCGEPYTSEVQLVNPGSLPLSGMKAEVVSAPEGCTASLRIPTTVGGGGHVGLSYTLNGSVASSTKEWEHLTIRVTSAEGAQLDLLLYYYCRPAEALLACNKDSLLMTVSKGKTREIPLQVTNLGHGETGPLKLAMPEGFSLVSSTPSLKQGESATIVLRFTPFDRMQLNVPMTGSIGVNCPNGQGVIIPFSMTLVSEAKGFLLVDVCDEYTYNTAEAPHVQDATVVVKHPTSGEVLAEGTTGADGTFTTELTEGYYRLEVSADKHEEYANYVFINPAATERVIVNIGYQPITISWEVEETEVEDEYHIVTNVQYETNVPIPVVKIDIPERIDGDNMAVGDAVLIDMKLTNLGLIKAENVIPLLPEDDEEWHFESMGMNEGFTLLPNDSVVIPIRITRIGDTSQAATARLKNVVGDATHSMIDAYGNCMKSMEAAYEHECGDTLRKNKSAQALAMKACAYSATGQFIMHLLSGIGGGGPGSPGGGGGGGGGGGNGNVGEVTKTLDICDPCDAQKMEKLIAKGLKYTWLGALDEAISKAIEAFQKNEDPDLIYVIKDVNDNILDKVDEAHLEEALGEYSGVVDIIYDVYEIIEPCDSADINGDSNARTYLRKAKKHDWIEAFEKVGKSFASQLQAIDSLAAIAFGDRIWFNEMDKQKSEFMKWVRQLPSGIIPTDEELLAKKPESVTFDQARDYVRYMLGMAEHMPSLNDIKAQFTAFTEADTEAKDKGFATMVDYFDSAYHDYERHFEEMASSSVCATLTLSFEQNMTMTRQAFRGKLKIFNGHEDTAMKDIRLNLLIRDMYGRVATAHEFQVNAESLNGFSGALDLSSGWTLGAQETGTATMLFIPTKFAAPEAPAEYSFGGSVTYIDPFTNLEVTRDLYPVVLTVKPSPELDLTYFMQRDLLGDDPLTAEVEPIVPAEFALIIDNKGYGDATDVRMVTQQPVITENEKGLLIDFQLISSQVNGRPAVLNFGEAIANSFGTIAAKSQAYAQWWLTSTLLGHFIDYDVTATHVTSYGNEDLSLLDQVSIHELIHGFTPADWLNAEGTGRGFLVNDVSDAEDLPDEVYFTDGTQKSVNKATGATISSLGQDAYLLNISPSAMGWNYGSLADPTNGRLQLASIIRRRDGASIPTDNVWQTPVTLRDGKDPIHENRLHFICESQGAAENWLLTFEERQEETAIQNVLADQTGCQERIVITPLPLGERLYVKGNFSEIQQLTVYDMNGLKRLQSNHLRQGEPVYTGHLPAGVYHVQLHTDRGIYSQKVLKR